MADIFDALMGQNPDPAELASALRRQQALGTIASMTGVEGLQRLGPKMMEQAAQGGQDYATLRDRTQNQMLQRAIALQNAQQASQDRQMAITAADERAKEHNALVRAMAAQRTPSPEQAGLSPDAVHDAVIDVLADPARMRQYASFGQAGQGVRMSINNEKAKTLRELGLTEDQIVRQQALAKGQIKSINDLVPMRNAISAYETVAQGNGQRALELINKVNTTGIPLLNRAKRLGSQAMGNPDAAELVQVLQNYQTEVARIVANPRLVGQLTDTARKEIEGVIPADLTPQQAERIIKRLDFEFALRGRGIDQALEAAQGGLTPGYPQQPTQAAVQPPSSATPKRIKVDANGNVIP